MADLDHGFIKSDETELFNTSVSRKLIWRAAAKTVEMPADDKKCVMAQIKITGLAGYDYYNPVRQYGIYMNNDATLFRYCEKRPAGYYRYSMPTLIGERIFK